MTTPNAELAYAVLDHIDANPRSWDQNTWWCGTAACFGGHAILLAGGEIQFGKGGNLAVTGLPELAGLDIDDAALKVLGLADGWVNDPDDDPDYDGEWLFSCTNDREDLGRLVAALFGPRPDGAS